MEATIGDQVFSVVLGGFLDRVNRSVEQVIEEGRNAGIELEIETGREIGLTIENVKNAFHSQLDYSVEKISQEANQALTRLTGVVDEFEQKEQQILVELMGRAQQLANTLPFSNKMPQLRNISPRCFVVPEEGETALVHFNGNFPWAGKPGFEPKLTFAGKACSLVDNGTQKFSFSLPLESFRKSERTLFSYRTGQLTISWDDGWIRSHKVDFNYTVSFGALPIMAGLVKVKYGSIERKREDHEASHSFSYNGNNWYPEEWHTIHQHIAPREGWLVDTAQKPTIREFKGAHGTHNESIESVASNDIVMRVELWCGSGHKMGIVSVWVDFQEYRYVSEREERVEEFSIPWGQMKLIEPKNDEVISSVTFTAYDGTEQVFGKPSIDHGVLKSQLIDDGRWQIWAKPPLL